MNIVKCLRTFDFVEKIEVLDFRVFEKGFYMKLEITLKDTSKVFIREYVDEAVRDYSYHWQTEDGSLIARWDSAPHHKEVKTHPHHKHYKGKVLESYSITCEDIFKEIKSILMNKEN
jgi:hypothetical protein